MTETEAESDNQTPLRAIAVLNRDSGTLKRADCDQFADHLRTAFEAAGRSCEVLPRRGPDTIEALESAAENEDFDAIIAVGGDGTISAAAELAWKNGKVLGVVPGGTMNLYAQSLGMPLELFAAAEALAAGKVMNADIATANGRPFVQQFSVGLQPRVVIERNKLGYQSRFSKLLASTRAALSAFTRPPAFLADIKYDGATRSGRYSLIAVSNNPYGEGHMPYADTVDSGLLGVYSAPVLSASDNARLAGDLLFGTWRNSPDLQAGTARRVEISFTRLKKSAMAVVDGELVPLQAHVTIKMHAGELQVLAPARPDEV